MKKIALFALAALAALVLAPSSIVRGDDAPAITPAPKAALPLVIYSDGQKSNPWIASGYMGSDVSQVKMDANCTDSPHSGKTCLKVDFTSGDGWGGVQWQSPANDWENQKPGGYDLTGAKKLTFWAKGAKGGEVVSFFCGGKQDDKPYHNTADGKLDKVALTADWKEYTIDLTGKDLTRIKSGFEWVLGASGSPVEFYLDDIQYE